ncbi:polysaccharide deacetylase family protein [Paenibacillus terrigena]|uniref:polysaccharide deacetylase family protein n=1 Tax=Paenibacillus terrigena TaxID=369333 RepID=UPI0028D47923|nr:polysaccharide deacetylase family protein [Paenibacillus terrigena]
MKMKKRRLLLMIIVTIVFTCLPIGVQAETAKIKSEPKPRTEYLTQIREEAQKRFIPPINARLDHVWYAIPGYNGLEVDVEKTYDLAKHHSNAPIRYVYREVVPAINLHDLGPNPIYRGNPKKRMASLMINVAWGDEFIPNILDVLEKEQVRATFFFDGSWLSKHIDTAKIIAGKGHELSNHAYSHKNMSQLSRGQALKEIEKTEDLLRNQLGINNKLFAPPSGDYSKETVKIADALHLKTILWTVDTVDWRHPSPDAIISKIAKQVESGSLILMHPTNSSSRALKGMIQEIKRKGLILNTVSEVISTQRTPDFSPLILGEPVIRNPV